MLSDIAYVLRNLQWDGAIGPVYRDAVASASGRSLWRNRGL